METSSTSSKDDDDMPNGGSKSHLLGKKLPAAERDNVDMMKIDNKFTSGHELFTQIQ